MSTTALPTFVSPEPASYEELRSEYLAFFSLLAGKLTIVLVMAGTMLDWFYYPQHWLHFFSARVVASLGVAAALYGAHRKASWRFTESSTMVWVQFPQAMICYMIAVTGGVESIYFVGLTYALTGLAVFLPLKVGQATVFATSTILMYLIACVVGTQGPVLRSEFGGHLVFLSFFVVVLFAVTIYSDKWRHDMYQLQQKIRGQRDDLSKSNKLLADAKVQIVQSEKMASLGTLAAGLLHEMNNPVNYSQIALRLAADEIKGGNLQAATASVDDALLGVKRLAGIIGDLRHLAYQTPDSETSSSSQFKLIEVVRIATRLTNHVCKGFVVETDVDPQIVVRGDSAAIVSVLVNLIENSAHSIHKAQRGPDGRITIKAERISNGDLISILVRDNGVGMRSEVARRIFEPFFTTKEVHEGMGLGLSIAYAVVRRHGSELRVTAVGDGVCELKFDLEVIHDDTKDLVGWPSFGGPTGHATNPGGR